MNNACVSDESLWKRPQVKVTVDNDVQLAEVVKICQVSPMLSNLSLLRLEKILRGEDEAWKIYAVEAKGECRSRLKMIGRTEGKKWARRGDFEMEANYYKAEVEIEALSATVISWKAVITEENLETSRVRPRYPGVLPRAAMVRAAAV